MFEKEAEEYVRKIRHDVINWDGAEPEERFYNEIKLKQAYQQGAEFGYNKTNEWHDLRKDSNDLPDNGRRVLVKDKSIRGYDVACLCRSKGNSDFWSYERFISRVSDNYIIAWCELPKFEE